MSEFESRKEILALKIELMRSRIANLQLALNTYRILRSIQFDHTAATSTQKSSETDIKIDNTIQKINIAIRNLHSFETELSAIQDSNI